MTRILIVDNNLQNLHLLEVILKGYDYDVISARNGKVALKLAQENLPDIIISDILMPVMDGFELCRQLKTDDRLKQIPFIFFTATYSEPQDEQYALNLGADRFIIKPQKPEVLVQVVRDLLKADHKKKSVPAEVHGKNEVEIMQHYNDVLFRKLEKKVAQLENEIINHNQTEKALIKSEKKYRRLYESMHDAFVSIDMDGCIMEYNSAFKTMLGYEDEGLLGLAYMNITPVQWHQLEIDIIKNQILKYGYSEIYEKEFIRKDGTIFPAELHISLTRDDDGQPSMMWAIVRDITERKQAEEKIKTSLAEKEVLIRELYHRTKNNMQVISAMLNIQLKYTPDEKIKNVFKAMENRIQSMALVQQKLYRSKDLSSINLKEYIKELTGYLMNSYNITDKKIKLDLTGLEDIFVLIDSAIPCGLVMNELISNSLKYAFPGQNTGEIKISLFHNSEKEIEIKYKDDGIGVHQGFNFRTDAKMGFTSVFNIVENQMKGKIFIENRNGISVTICFKDIFYESRV